VQCKHRSVNCRRVLDTRRTFRPAFGVTDICEVECRSNVNLWWLRQEYYGNNCDSFGNMWECQTEHLVHQGVSSNQCEYHKETLRDVWALMHTCCADSGHYLILPGWALAIEFPRWRKNALIIVHYLFRIILWIVCFYIGFRATLHRGTKETVPWFKHNGR